MSRLSHRIAVPGIVLVLVLTGAVGVAHAGPFVNESGNDLDCDGARDAIVVTQFEGIDNAGAVAVRYSRDGSTDLITQASPGVYGDPEPDDQFGSSTTAYDWNQDGCDDLLVGVPYEDIGSLVNAGMVTIIPGSPAGLDTAASVSFTQDSPSYPGAAEAWDWFGWSLASGRTNQGVPFLLIGSPGESGPSAASWQAGSVYYVRPDLVVAFHQDSPGVDGVREQGDFFGDTLAASDRFIAVGTPQEQVAGGDDGMVHVFSHPGSSGPPTPLAGFHQNTPGISGAAEWGDRFGWSLSVLSYRHTASGPIGALVAVGAWETVGSAAQAGMAHLVRVSPSGGVAEVAAVTQANAGVTGAAEAGDYLGYDVALANLDPGSAVATPASTVWAVAVGFEEGSGDLDGAVHVFPPGWTPGEPDIWLQEGTAGIGPLAEVSALRASATHLHLGSAIYACQGVPWDNILHDAGLPVVSRLDGCR